MVYLSKILQVPITCQLKLWCHLQLPLALVDQLGIFLLLDHGLEYFNLKVVSIDYYGALVLRNCSDILPIQIKGLLQNSGTNSLSHPYLITMSSHRIR